MNLNLEGVAKAVYVGFLLIMWVVLVKLGIRDDTLIDVIKALIGVVVGWHGINEWGGGRRAAVPLAAAATLGGYQPGSGPLGDPPTTNASATNVTVTASGGVRTTDVAAPPPGANQ